MRCALLLLSLLLAACGRAFDGPPGIVFEREVIDLGAVPPGTERDCTLGWRRTGAGALRVLALETDCGCALAEGPRGVQPPGGRGLVRLRFRGGRRHGPFVHRVTLYTDQPAPRAAVRARVRGWSGAPLALAPATLELGLRSPAVILERDVEVWLDPSLDRDDLAVRLRGLEGQATLLPPRRRGVAGRLLRLRLIAPAAAGRFEGRVLLERGGGLLGALPVRGEVRRPVPRPRRSAHPGPDRPR